MDAYPPSPYSAKADYLSAIGIDANAFLEWRKKAIKSGIVDDWDIVLLAYANAQAKQSRHTGMGLDWEADVQAIGLNARAVKEVSYQVWYDKSTDTELVQLTVRVLFPPICDS